MVRKRISGREKVTLVNGRVLEYRILVKNTSQTHCKSRLIKEEAKVSVIKMLLCRGDKNK